MASKRRNVHMTPSQQLYAADELNTTADWKTGKRGLVSESLQDIQSQMGGKLHVIISAYFRRLLLIVLVDVPKFLTIFSDAVGVTTVTAKRRPTSIPITLLPACSSQSKSGRILPGYLQLNVIHLSALLKELEDLEPPSADVRKKPDTTERHRKKTCHSGFTSDAPQYTKLAQK
ncbi:hypothetical protein AAG570_010476 [Ranatra chinensis]|uniref:Uncharacterized protein n=1 Tax=Ranatra chinensis TaxID=642074 RepID=A0ABD0YMN3_9HEMI